MYYNICSPNYTTELCRRRQTPNQAGVKFRPA